MSNAKKLSPKEKAWKEFLDAYNDTELQERYVRFKRDEKEYVEEFNAMVKPINDAMVDRITLEQIILNCAMLGITAPEAVAKLKQTNSWIEDTQEKMNGLKAKIAEAQKLIKQYKDSSERDLFVYWKMLNAVDETVGPYHEFSQKYKNRIF